MQLIGWGGGAPQTLTVVVFAMPVLLFLCVSSHGVYRSMPTNRVDRGCSGYGIRVLDESFRHWSVPLPPVKCRLTRLRVTNPPRARKKTLPGTSITFDDFVGWVAHQTVLSVACNFRL